MEERKQKEADYYNKRASQWLQSESSEKWEGDFEGFNPLVLGSYKFLYKVLEKESHGKRLLDYGCGNGIHSIFPAKQGGASSGN